MAFNILFLTGVRIDNYSNTGIYNDLIREFIRCGNRVTVVCPVERRFKIKSRVLTQGDLKIIQCRTLNFQKTSSIEKGLATLLMDKIFLRSVKKWVNKVEETDFILYSTPPVTFFETVNYVKQRSNALSYLMLKDIFPQNAIDIGLLKKRSLLHRYFLRCEQQLYESADIIGCMSPANVSFLLSNHPELKKKKIELCPNAIEIRQSLHEPLDILRSDFLYQLGIPEKPLLCIYGGNLGKPQGIDFLLRVLEEFLERNEFFFVIVGDGTEYDRIQNWFRVIKPSNAKLMAAMEKNNFDILVRFSDVGLIFLDKRFTIPNFPSRMLSYMQFSKPILAATDPVTDIGEIMAKGGFGLSVVSGDIDGFKSSLLHLEQSKSLREKMGRNGFNYLEKNYNVANVCQNILSHFVTLKS